MLFLSKKKKYKGKRFFRSTPLDSSETPSNTISFLILLYIAYYLPLSALKVELQRSSKSSFCEWKGNATYWNVPKPNAAPGTYEKNRVWSYENPTKDFKPIKGYLSFYASPWDCYVDDEKVEAQPGDFYGGWMTSEIEGKVKGGPGTWGW